MISEHAILALADLDAGARLNTVHTIGRELIAAGLAIDNFGFLELTEAGRRAARVKAVRQFVIHDDQVADMSWRRDPMANPFAPASLPMDSPTANVPSPNAWVELPIAPEPAPVALDPTTDETVRAYRAAGVATGKTGIEVEAKWVIAFVEAWGTM